MHFKQGRKSCMTDDEFDREQMVSEVCKECYRHKDVCICENITKRG